MAKTNAKKQKDYKARQNKIGNIRREYWATESQHIKLKDYLEKLKNGNNINNT